MVSQLIARARSLWRGASAANSPSASLLSTYSVCSPRKIRLSTRLSQPRATSSGSASRRRIRSTCSGRTATVTRSPSAGRAAAPKRPAAMLTPLASLISAPCPVARTTMPSRKLDLPTKPAT